MIINSQQRLTSRRTSGFTLVEILVVLLIMAILTGLGIGLLGTSGTQARIAATQTTLKHLDGLIRSRSESLRTAKLKREIAAFKLAYETANGMSLSPQDLKAAEILIRKNILREMLPQRLEDFYGFDGVADMPSVWASGGGDDSPLLRLMYDSSGMLKSDSWLALNATATASTDVQDKAESSELLYLALTKGSAYGLTPVSLDGLPSTAFGDTDGDTNMEILDAWGVPIQFFRWPTGLTAEDPPGSGTRPRLVQAKLLVVGLPADVSKDPDDPLRVLEKSAKFSAFAPIMMPPSSFDLEIGGATVSAKAFGVDPYHEKGAYHTPLLISGGPDRVIGVSDIHADAIDGELAADDITNRQGK